MELKKVNKLYQTHAKFYDLTRKFFLFNRKKAIERLELKKNDEVLDLACGTGLNIPLLLKKVNSKGVVGIDYSNAMLKKARKKYPVIKFIQGDVSNYKFNKKFDKIICTYSLSIIDEWKKTIKNVKNSLKKDGVFVVLDFYKWKGIMKLSYPIFRNYLNRFGVNPEKNIEFFLKKNFKEVDMKILNSGYNFIAVARVPKNNKS